MPDGSQALASERVIVEAPGSYTGATKRILRFTEPGRAMSVRHLASSPTWWRKLGTALLDVTIVSLLCLWLLTTWMIVTCWYLFFGIFLVPYRLIRRHSREAKRQQLQHREILAQAQAAQAEAIRQAQHRDDKNH